ncbi:MAG: anti-sigma factor family protein [Actinomycetota bacterium]
MRWFRHPDRALDAYLDGELDPRGTERITEHLNRCGPCRQRSALTRRIRVALRTMTRKLST